MNTDILVLKEHLDEEYPSDGTKAVIQSILKEVEAETELDKKQEILNQRMQKIEIPLLIDEFTFMMKAYYADDHEAIAEICKETVEKLKTTGDVETAYAIAEEARSRMDVLIVVPAVELKADAEIARPSANEVVNVTKYVADNSLNATAEIPAGAIGLADNEKDSGVWVWAEVKELSAEEIDASDVNLISQSLNGATVASYLNIELYKQVPGEDKILVSETNKPITITIQVPENLRGANRSFSIVYTHDGEAAKTIVPLNYDATTGVLVFEASKFSTYALVYSETETTNPKTGSDQTNTQKQGKTGTAKVSSAVPQTGDNSQMALYGGLMLLSLAVVAALAVGKARRGRCE